MAISPIDYTSGNGFAQGLQLKGLQEEIQQRSLANEQAQADQIRRQSFYDAIGSATPDQLPALRRQFPEYAQNIQQEIGIQGAEHASFVNGALNQLSVAAASGNPQQVQLAIQQNAPALASLGVSPDQAAQLYQQDPQQFNSLLNATRMATMPVDKQFDVQQNQQKIDETARSNRASEANTIRGQDVAAATARRAQDMANQRASARTMAAADGSRVVQLADGRTVNVGGKLHGAGANAFYEGIDDNGNMVRVPASAIAAPATSAASAQNYAMAKDLDAIEGADAQAGDLDFLTGVTGGNGTPALGSDYRSRLTGGEQRKLYNAAQRIQGKMQNQGIAAARDMGASGINTVAEAKMYFQGMPQLDFSSPESAQESVKNIRQYTDQYNQQYNVNVGGGQSQPSQPARQQSSGFSSLWGD